MVRKRKKSTGGKRGWGGERREVAYWQGEESQ